MRQLSKQAHPGFPVTIYYAFKQSESKGSSGTTSTGCETFLGALMYAGFSITGTWPMRTEQPKGLRTFEQNALASSIVLVCRARQTDAPRRHAPRVSDRAPFGTAAGATPPPNRQRRPRRPCPSRHRPRHGGIHPLRAAARHVVFVAGTGGQTERSRHRHRRPAILPDLVRGTEEPHRHYPDCAPAEAGRALAKTVHRVHEMFSERAREQSDRTIGRIAFDSGIQSVVPGWTEVHRPFRDQGEATPVSEPDVQATDWTAPDVRRGPP